MPIALPALGSLLVVLWAIATALLIAVILGYIAGVLHGLPFPINQLAGPVNSLASGITEVCWKAIHKTEQLIGASFHWLSNYTDKLWHAVEKSFYIHATAAKVAVAHGTAINKLAAEWRSQRARVAAHSSAVKVLEREVHGIDREIKKIERELGKGIGADVQPQIKELQREVNTLSRREAHDVAAATKHADSAISDLWSWITGVATRPVALTFTGAVAVALSSLGLSWLRCNSNPFTRNPAACGLLSDLARFLPFLGLLAISFDFEEFTDAAELLAQGIGSTVASIEGSFTTTLPPLPPPN